jgi:hypothetical protein
MTRSIRNTGSTYKPIRNTGPTLPRLEPSVVADALGAEPASETLEGALSPILLFRLRQKLVKRSQSGKDGLR